MDVIDLLRELVSIKTVNSPFQGVKPGPEAAKFIRDLLEDWGLQTEVIESGGYYTVFGKLGRGPPCVAVLAHYDTVPADPSEWSYDPYTLTVVDGRAYGRGALDDKSNVAALMLALRRLVEEEPRCSVVYAFTGDEETGGVHGAKVVAQRLAEEGSIPRYLINGDGYGMTVIIRRRKVFKAVIEVEQRKQRIRGSIRRAVFRSSYPVSQHAHAAYFIPGVDTHPLIAASVFVRERRVGVIELGGRFLKSNVVPSEIELIYVEPGEGEVVEYDEALTRLLYAVMPLCRACIPTERFSEYGTSITPNSYRVDGSRHVLELDIRAMVRDPGIVDTALNEVVMNLGLNATLRVVDSGGSYLYTPPTSPVVEALSRALKEVGEEPMLAEGAGATDSRFFTELGTEVVDFGPRGGGMHGVDEYVELDSLRKLPEIYLKALRHLLSRCQVEERLEPRHT